VGGVKIGIVGTGLMGTSVALAAARRGDEVSGWDPDDAALAASVARGALDAAASLEQAVVGADLAVVAAPIAQLPGVVADVLQAAGPQTTITDVASTKASVVAATNGAARFVGGHPICGAETRGAENANADLFQGATWFLTPAAQTDAESYRLVHSLVSDLGATPVAIDAAAHDRLVALTSHVPHVLANIVANHVGAARVEGHEPLANAGGSLRDMTRIAGANPRIWVDIFLDNAEQIRGELAEHRRRIEQVEDALAQGNAGFLARWIGEASQNRRRMLEREYPSPGELQRLRVHVPDRPGVLAGITQALGAERINIEDFELHHMSPERGGTLTLLVTGEGEARRAAELLEGQGYGVITSTVLSKDGVDEG
jgi:prephenate dehydrogenase